MNLAPLRQRNFSLLWWAGLISITGDWAIRIALPIYVLRLTGSALAVASIILVSLLPNLLLGMIAGAYVDRWDRRKVVIVVNLLLALTMLPLVLVNSADRVWLVVVCAFVESVLSQFFAPAENALLPRLVSAENLTAANSLNSLNNNIGRLIGPAVGGLAAAALGLAGAALLDVGTFVIAAGLCALITGSHRADRTGEEKRHLFHDIADGLRAIGHNRIVRAIVIVLTLTTIGEGMMGALFAIFVTRALHGGGQEMGWMMSSQAIGGILGSLAGTWISARYRPVALIAWCMFVFGVIDLAIFNWPRVSTEIWPVLVMFVLVGLPAGIGFAALMTLFQTQTPDRLRGRVFAALMVMQAVAAMVGAGIAGALGDQVSVVNLLTAQGTGYAIAGVLLRVLAGRGPADLVEPQPAAAEAADRAPDHDPADFLVGQPNRVSVET